MRASGDERSATRTERILAVSMLALCLLSLAQLAATLAPRIAFPWPLEWMEGGVQHHALRLLAGQGIYVEPSAEFVPYLYPPLGYLPMAASMALFGPTLVAARLPSLLALVVTLGSVARAAQRLARTRLAAWAAVASFAIGYGYAGAFMDLARVDACFIALVALGIERALSGSRAAALAWFALSVLAKQHGLLFVVAYGGHELVVHGRAALRPVVAAGLALMLAVVALELHSGGLFLRYVVELPRAHGLSPGLLVSYVLVDIAIYLPLLSVASSIGVLRGDARWKMFAWFLLAAIAAGALGRAHPGGHDNVRLPSLLALSIGGGAVVGGIVADRARSLRLRASLTAGLALQCALLWQPPSYHRPPAGSAAAFGELCAALARCGDGRPGIALDFPLACGPPFVHTMALSDLMLAGPSRLELRAERALLARLSSPGAPLALAVGEMFPGLARGLASHYGECARVRSPALPPGGYRPGHRAGGPGKVRFEQVIYRRLP